MARPRAKSTTPQFSFRIDPALRSDLECLADADDRTLGYYIERVLRQHRDKNKKRVIELRRKDPDSIEYHMPQNEFEELVAEAAGPVPDFAAKADASLKAISRKKSRGKPSAPGHSSPASPKSEPPAQA